MNYCFPLSDIPRSLLPVGGPQETCTQAVDRRKKMVAGERKPVVLVADDEVLIRDTMVEILRLEGYDAVGVKDGQEAVECASELKPEVFLADIQMPRLNGLEAAKIIRGLLPGTRIIYFSGHASTLQLMEDTCPGDPVEFLSKPIKPATLVAKVRQKLS